MSLDDGFALARRMRGMQPAAPDTTGRETPEWMRTAPCRGLDAIFYNEVSGFAGALVTRRAKEICARCPHRADCLALAMTAEHGNGAYHRFGVFGGLEGAERGELAKTGWRPGDPLPRIQFDGREIA